MVVVLLPLSLSVYKGKLDHSGGGGGGGGSGSGLAAAAAAAVVAMAAVDDNCWQKQPARRALMAA